MKNPLLSSPYLVKKRQFCQNYTLLWAYKSIRCQFFRFFTKNNCFHAHILSTKRPFSKKHTLLSCPYFVKKHSFSKNHDALMPIFSQKNVRSLKKNCALMSLFLILHEKPPAAMPILGSKKVISVKITILWTK